MEQYAKTEQNRHKDKQLLVLPFISNYLFSLNVVTDTNLESSWKTAQFSGC